MYKKKIIYLLILVLLLTGCSCQRITSDLDTVVRTTMSKSSTSVNTVSTGYELYIPTGVSQIKDNEYNQKFKIRDRYVYLYVDTVSYYYKNMLNYKKSEDYSYYYKEFAIDGKTGYVGVNKIKEAEYFCEIVYNYAKIEFYSDDDNLPVIMADSLIILNSIKFNDNLIKTKLNDSAGDSKEVKYELDKPKDTESTFSKYLQEYVSDDEQSDEKNIGLPGED